MNTKLKLIGQNKTTKREKIPGIQRVKPVTIHTVVRGRKDEFTGTPLKRGKHIFIGFNYIIL